MKFTNRLNRAKKKKRQAELKAARKAEELEQAKIDDERRKLAALAQAREELQKDPRAIEIMEQLKRPDLYEALDEIWKTWPGKKRGERKLVEFHPFEIDEKTFDGDVRKAIVKALTQGARVSIEGGSKDTRDGKVIKERDRGTVTVVTYASEVRAYKFEVKGRLNKENGTPEYCYYVSSFQSMDDLLDDVAEKLVSGQEIRPRMGRVLQTIRRTKKTRVVRDEEMDARALRDW
jgi:hypothetical protein